MPAIYAKADIQFANFLSLLYENLHFKRREWRQAIERNEVNRMTIISPLIQHILYNIQQKEASEQQTDEINNTIREALLLLNSEEFSFQNNLKAPELAIRFISKVNACFHPPVLCIELFSSISILPLEQHYCNCVTIIY